ncbi:MAG TPA: DUF1080 domain-containing protein [Chthoniobacteraceae bacterium]|nr:DUF1080 domain-containing protein [Chthoniobacteraceae bacterium]
MKSALLSMLAVVSLASVASAQEKALGHQDTPLIPGTKWHVHDGERPQPPIVTPGQPPILEAGTDKPPTPATPPSDAIVLFDGKDLFEWRDAKGGDAKWKIEDGHMEVVPGSGDIFTKDEFGPDVQLHVEFATPPPVGDGQGRGNSGIFLYGRYEIQVLDNYDNPTYPDGQATAIYGYMPPQVNACRPHAEWQTYDIIFEGPRFKEGKLEKPAIVTILHNGVVTQNHTALIGETPHKQVGTYHEHPLKGPIKLQDHHNPMRFRNIWIRDLRMPTPEDIGDGPQIGK